MKRIVVMYIALLLLVAGCGQEGDPSDRSSSESTSDSTISPEDPPESSESSKQAEESSDSPVEAESNDPQTNHALELIPGGERLLESDEGLYLLKEYGFEMKWMEANQIEHLDRGTPPVDSQQTYFLLLPKYPGTQILVERMDWDGADFTPVEVLYSNESTSENYGLVLTSDEPEASINLRVTVTYQDRTAGNVFGYDGRGDRPAVRVMPDDENWWENEDFAQ